MNRREDEWMNEWKACSIPWHLTNGSGSSPLSWRWPLRLKKIRTKPGSHKSRGDMEAQSCTLLPPSWFQNCRILAQQKHIHMYSITFLVKKVQWWQFKQKWIFRTGSITSSFFLIFGLVQSLKDRKVISILPRYLFWNTYQDTIAL